MKTLDPSMLRSIDERLQERYSRRLARYGTDPRTLGWDTKANQHARFWIATSEFDFAGKNVLDVGCGLADFYGYLQECDIPIAQYAGMDINPDLIETAREHYPDTILSTGNFLLDAPPLDSCDVVVMFGVMNFRFSEIDNWDFARQMIRRAYEYAKEAIVVDMLSEIRDPDYPREDFVYYYHPETVLRFALQLTRDVVIRHDRPAIPQKEFTLILRKTL